MSMNEHSYLNKRLSCQFLSKCPLLWERSPRSLVENSQESTDIALPLEVDSNCFPLQVNKQERSIPRSKD